MGICPVSAIAKTDAKNIVHLPFTSLSRTIPPNSLPDFPPAIHLSDPSVWAPFDKYCLILVLPFSFPVHILQAFPASLFAQAFYLKCHLLPKTLPQLLHGATAGVSGFGLQWGMFHPGCEVSRLYSGILLWLVLSQFLGFFKLMTWFFWMNPFPKIENLFGLFSPPACETQSYRDSQSSSPANICPKHQWKIDQESSLVYHYLVLGSDDHCIQILSVSHPSQALGSIYVRYLKSPTVTTCSNHLPPWSWEGYSCNNIVIKMQYRISKPKDFIASSTLNTLSIFTLLYFISSAHPTLCGLLVTSRCSSTQQESSQSPVVATLPRFSTCQPRRLNT